MSASAFADELVFKNGDKLTGTITAVEGGKLTINTTMAGTVTVDLTNVQTFSTDAPIAIRTNSGSKLVQTAKASEEPGKIKTEGGDVAPQTVALTDIKDVNHPAPKWTGSVVINGDLTRGNTHTESVGATATAVQRREDDRISLDAGYAFGRQRDPSTGGNITTTDNWFGQGKYDYFFTPKFYGYGMVRVERDNIANLDLRLSPGVGVGYQWVERPDFNFNTEAGLTWVYESFSDDGTEDHVAARLAYHLDKKLNDKVSLFHDLEYLPSLEDISDFNVNADGGLRVALSASMFTEFKVEWKHDNTPAPGALKDDLHYVLGIGWNF
jgi:putative salt-induced outer membrane protein YdiY